MQYEDMTARDAAKRVMMDAGYSEQAIEEALEYATAHVGDTDADAIAQAAVSYMLYGESQLASGDLVGWENGYVESHINRRGQ
jgi:hypothetical protein